jgi:HlyD family secretion protein
MLKKVSEKLKISQRAIRWIAAAAAIVVVGLGAFGYWKSRQNALPDGIIAGNGRIEGKLVDVAAREPLRVKELFAQEGDLVRPGQVLARMDTETLEAELAQANAAVAAAEEKLAVAGANIVKQKSEIGLAAIETNRAAHLVEDGAGSQRDLDVRKTRLQTTQASLGEATAALKTSEQEVEVAKANAVTVQTRIDDATLRSAVTGRVLYRLAEPGEVMGAGGKVMTLVNLEDIYMEIFVPSQYAASVKIGAEGRITLDFDPKRAVAGYVSFVSPEAQFTPKFVETQTEREKLMFRVKVQVPKEVADQYVESIKTGVRGMGYIKVKPAAVWPARLQNLVTAQPQAHL